jgi:hypothetical protein
MCTSRCRASRYKKGGEIHPVGIDTSPLIVAEDKLNKTRDGRTFVVKQSVRNLKMHSGV